jgi:hypothetical protein
MSRQGLLEGNNARSTRRVRLRTLRGCAESRKTASLPNGREVGRRPLTCVSPACHMVDGTMIFESDRPANMCGLVPCECRVNRNPEPTACTSSAAVVVEFFVSFVGFCSKMTGTRRTRYLPILTKALFSRRRLGWRGLPAVIFSFSSRPCMTSGRQRRRICWLVLPAANEP